MNGRCTALEAANYFIFLLSDVCDDLSNMKLNKLLYYAQGHHLRKSGVPLFDENIEAWDHGPVVESVYKAYKSYGDSSIKNYDEAKANEMPTDVADFLQDVARQYCKYTASALRNMTHAPNTPWDKVFVEGKKHIVISKDSMMDYFSRFEKDIEPLSLPLSNEDFIGYRDKDGYLVLPKEWNDETV